MPFICSREVDLYKYQPSSDSHLILIQKDIMFLCLTSMMWETLWPTFDQGHFLSTSAHYPKSWSRDSLLVPWSLHASMAGSSYSTWGFHHWPQIEWFCGCSTSAHCSHAVDCTCSTLRTIFIIGRTSINNFHHWLVIKRCSCMFDFSSHIRMLELVLCSGRDGAQDPGFLSVII